MATRHWCLDDSPTFRWLELGLVDSTNRYLCGYRPTCEVPLTLATADYQTDGKGADANHWESDPGKNLLFSLLWLTTNLPAQRVFTGLEMLALSVLDALNDFAPGFTIKWPNDIYFGDWKVAGTLIENEFAGKRVARSVMGTGINVNQMVFHSDAPNPRSLAQIVGHEVELHLVLQGVMYHFARYRRMVEQEQYDVLHTLYTSQLYRREGEHAYADSEGTFHARITDVQPDGHLILTDTEGRQRRYAFKEVRMVPDTNHSTQ